MDGSKPKNKKIDNSPLCPWNPTAFNKLSPDGDGIIPTRTSEFLLLKKDEPTENGLTKSTQSTDSIECVGGNYTNFFAVSESLQKYNVSFRKDSTEFKQNIKVAADKIQRISIICCRIKSCKGINTFPNLAQLFISDGKISELLWEDFEFSHDIQEITIVYSGMREIETLQFTRLTKLCLWANKLKSLDFLGHGLPNLKELNVAENEITTLHESNIFKCFNLEIINLAGNPISSISDIKALRVCHSLRSLFMLDSQHGGCPIVSICSYRSMIISLMENLLFLDGLEIREDDRQFFEEMFASSCLKYTAFETEKSSDPCEKLSSLREKAVADLAVIGKRLHNLLGISVQLTRMLKHISFVPTVGPHITSMKKDSIKLEARIGSLKSLCNKIMKDFSKMLKIGKWEKEVQMWLNSTDYNSYGCIQGENIYSSLERSSTFEKTKQRNNSSKDFMDFIRTSSCQYSYPKKTKNTVESIFIVRQHATNIALQQVYLQTYAGQNEPEFIKPVPSTTSDHPRTPLPMYRNMSAKLTQCALDCYNRDSMKVIPKTFRNPDWRSYLLHDFPDSVKGLQDVGCTWYMFLICPEGKKESPLEYLYRLMNAKADVYKSVHLTTCAWKAINRKSFYQPFSVLLVVKVLRDYLRPIEDDKINDALHHDKICQTYCLKQGLTFTPAFILFLSFLPLEKKIFTGAMDDEDVTSKATTRLQQVVRLLGNLMSRRRMRLSKTNMFINQAEDQLISADLTSLVKKLSSVKKQTVDGAENLLSGNGATYRESESFIADGNICRFLGDQSSHRISKLKLSCNYLSGLVNIQLLKQLRILDVSHNNLQNLETLPILPNLTDFKVQFNCLQCFETCLDELANKFPRLVILEILPNPFQDVHDWGSIPLLVQKKISQITRVDGWVIPFFNNFNLHKIKAPKVNADFTREYKD